MDLDQGRHRQQYIDEGLHENGGTLESKKEHQGGTQRNDAGRVQPYKHRTQCCRTQRRAWAIASKITTYMITDNTRVFHGTVMGATPGNRPTVGARANTIMVSFSATWLRVNSGSPLDKWLQTSTMAVHGAAASKMSPAI